MTKILWNLIPKEYFLYVFLFTFEIKKRNFFAKKHNSSKCGAMLL